MLLKMKRGHTLKHILESVELLLQGNLIPQLDFILGNPGESEDEQLQTIELCHALRKKGCSIRLHYFMPLPGTPWGDAPPSPLSQTIKSKAFALLKQESVNGSFSQQMRIAKPLLEYR